MANVIPALVEMQRNSEQTFAGGLRDLVAGIQQYKGQKEQDKLKELGQSFIQSGDYSPEGIQTFAKNNKVSPREMASIVQLASAFEQYKEEKDPLVPMTITNPDGSKTAKTMRQSALAGGIQTAPPATESEEPIDARGTMRLVDDAVKLLVPDSVGFDSTPQGKLQSLAEVARDPNRPPKQRMMAAAALNSAYKVWGIDPEKIDTDSVPQRSGNPMYDAFLRGVQKSGANDMMKQETPDLEQQFKQIQAVRPGTTWQDVQETAKEYGITEAEVLQRILSKR